MRFIPLILLVLLSGPGLCSDFVKIDLPTKADINKILFVGEAYGWAVTSDGELLSTYDGGKNWRVRKIGSRAINDIDMGDRRGYLIGERGLLMKSNDRGATWLDITMPMKFNFTGVGIINDSSAIICGTDQNSMSKTRGVLFQSWNYGKTWDKQSKMGNGYVDVVTVVPKNIYILAIKKTFHSINGGLNFFHGKYEGKRLAFGFDLDDAWGYMVGRKGYFARSTNHGRSWEEIDLDISKNLYAVKMFDHGSGIAVGEDGLILEFAEDGKKNSLTHCGYDADLLTVCVTESKIFCGGKDGTLLYKNRE